MPASKNSNAKGCGCLIVAALLIAGGCSALFGGGDNTDPASFTPPSIPSYTPWTPKPWTPDATPSPDLDGDGIEDRYDDDADGDGVQARNDIDDTDPDQGKRRPKRKATRRPQPQPEPEPVHIGNVHPGGFCGTPGAVGTASNGRTYTCLDGHWRR
ncbi:hypothetical protein ACFYUK_43935 [Nonomuraea wenchangensis]